VVTHCADNLPSYEFSVPSDVLDQFQIGSFPFSVSLEDNDNNYNQGTVCAIGANYTGSKLDDANNPWDNIAFYPFFNFSDVAGPVISVEKSAVAAPAVSISVYASPNPSTRTTSLYYGGKQAGTIKVYSTSGRMVAEYQVKAGSDKVVFNGGKLSSGVYIARLTSGKAVATAKIFLCM
jgi:hypothetical protein